jgi:hypothetical protein
MVECLNKFELLRTFHEIEQNTFCKKLLFCHFHCSTFMYIPLKLLSCLQRKKRRMRRSVLSGPTTMKSWRLLACLRQPPPPCDDKLTNYCSYLQEQTLSFSSFTLSYSWPPRLETQAERKKREQYSQPAREQLAWMVLTEAVTEIVSLQSTLKERSHRATRPPTKSSVFTPRQLWFIGARKEVDRHCLPPAYRCPLLASDAPSSMPKQAAGSVFPSFVLTSVSWPAIWRRQQMKQRRRRIDITYNKWLIHVQRKEVGHMYINNRQNSLPIIYTCTHSLGNTLKFTVVPPPPCSDHPIRREAVPGICSRGQWTVTLP